jgi:16S rRNA (guanine1207-N2)-methyltransferase
MTQTLASRDRANRLFDAYGALLTAQQRRLLQRYYQDDLSLGEIAEQMRVSRQAVHDGLRRALAALERYETALGLAAQAKGPRSGEHYFTARPTSTPSPRLLTVSLRGRTWTFETSAGVFASRRIDAGSRLLIQSMRVGPADHVLDLGCGYGPIGLVAATLAPRGRAWLVDANLRAAGLAQANARRHRLTNVGVFVGNAGSAVRDAAVDVVVTNPPIRAGRRAVQAFIDDAWRVLRPGGRFYLVARTAQGARTLARLITDRFGNAGQSASTQGYRVYEARRRAAARRLAPNGGSLRVPPSKETARV